jgi:hypothetical protein
MADDLASGAGTEPAETVETLTRKLASARFRIATLAEQLMTAERVQSGLRSRIAALEQQLDSSPRPIMLDSVIDLGPPRSNGQSAPPAATASPTTDTVHVDYAYGDHEDDLLPRSS